jgi:hypothetical protein
MRPHKFPTILVLALASLLSATEVTVFPLQRDLRPAIGQTQVVSLDLGSEFWREDGPQLRILDATGRAVPYLIRNATGWTNRVETVPCPLRGMDIREEADNALVFELRVGDDVPHPTLLDIETPLKDFERRVTIEGLGGVEASHLAEGLVYDYSRFADLRQTRVRLPEHSFRHLRVRIDGAIDETRSPIRQLTRRQTSDGGAEQGESTTVRDRPFRIDRIGLYAERTSMVQNGEREQSHAGIAWKSEVADGNLLHIEAVPPGLPVHGIGILSGASNFSYRATLDVGVGSDWRRVAEARLTRIRFGQSREERTILRFPEQRADRLRLTLHLLDNPPPALDGVVFQGPVPQALFLADPGTPYRVVYGGEAPVPNYDETLLNKALSETGLPMTVDPGPAQANPDYAAPAPPRWRFFGRMGFFRAAVLTMAAALGYALYRAARHVGTLGD